MMQDDLKEFETHDIYLAAFLDLSGCTLVRQRKQGQRKYFIFSNPAGPIKDLREAFFAAKVMMRPHEFCQKIIAYKQLAMGE